VNRIEVVRAANDWDNPDRNSYYSDDFQWTDALGSPPMDRDSWIAMGQLMKSAFPDISTVIEEIREEGDDVVVTSHFGGTFTNDLDLSALGMGVIPAKGKAFVFPTSTVRIGFDGDKIAKLHDPRTGPDAGLPGFLKALGVDMG
jgi:predicted ester cyclase